MRKKVVTIRALFLAVMAVWVASGDEIAPGVTYTELRFSRAAEGPFVMQVLEVDPRHPAVNLLAVRARDGGVGRETTGYFVTTGAYAGASTGVFVWNGEVVSAGSKQTALLFCREKRDVERLEFDVVNFEGWVVTESGPARMIDGVNQPRGKDALVVYRPVLGARTMTDANGVEAVIDASGTVVRIEEGSGNAQIPAGGSVVSGSGAGAAWLRENVRAGTRLKLDLAARPVRAKTCQATDVIGGGPKLVTRGKVDVHAERFAHEKTRHPRTGVGVTRHGTLLFVTLDGRQKQSVGMRLDEFASEMIRLGAVEAMNLDGGGSTTIVGGGLIRNSPSDGKERPVSDGILIYSVADKEALEKLRTTLAASPETAQKILAEAERGLAGAKKQ